MINVEPGIFLRFDPAAAPAPLFVDVSKSGLEYPAQFRSPVPFTTVHDNASMHVEALFADAPRYGATLLRCVFAAFFIDINRLIDAVRADTVSRIAR